MKVIEKQSYLSEVIELYGTPDIKAITNIRRCGKSLLLTEFSQYLKDENNHIVMIILQEIELLIFVSD